MDYEAADENQPVQIRKDPPKAEKTATQIEVLRRLQTNLGGVVASTYDASDWTATEDGDLLVYDGTDCIAQYVTGAWVRVRKVSGNEGVTP